jgi:hypothetical protein
MDIGIDYPIFINNLNSNYIDVIKKAEKLQMESYLSSQLDLKPTFSLIINNIN